MDYSHIETGSDQKENIQVDSKSARLTIANGWAWKEQKTHKNHGCHLGDEQTLVVVSEYKEDSGAGA